MDKTILQRLSEARVSDDLTHKHRLCDVDFCHGSGLAAIKHRVGAALMDLDLTLNRSAIMPAYRETINLYIAIGRKKQWSTNSRLAKKVAMEALRNYLNATCGECHGRGVLGVDRSDPDRGQTRACTACNATGKRPINGDSRTVRRVRTMLAVMERARREYSGAVRRKMRVMAEVE